jgi:hypothetical protein
MNRDKALRLFEMAWPAFSEIMQGLAKAGGIRTEPTAPPQQRPGAPAPAAEAATSTPTRRGPGRPRKTPTPTRAEKATPAKQAARTAKATPARAPGGRRGAKAKKTERTEERRERVELLSRILTSTAKAFGVKAPAILSKERGQELDLARAIAYYLTARLSKLPVPEIAGLFERDRVTLKSGIARIERLVTEDKDLAARVATLEEGLRSTRAAS